jgi:hypothetical protein
MSGVWFDVCVLLAFAAAIGVLMLVAWLYDHSGGVSEPSKDWAEFQEWGSRGR